MTLHANRTRSRRAIEAEEHEQARKAADAVLSIPHKQRKEGRNPTQNSQVSEPANIYNDPDMPELETDPEMVSENEESDSRSEKDDIPSLETVVAQGKEGVNLRSLVKDKYDDDPVFKAVMAAPKNYCNFEVEEGLIFVRLPDRRLLCIPKLKVGSRNVQEIVINEAHSILAHLGPKKTLAYVWDAVWWKTMAMDVQAFCKSCVVCQQTKAKNHKPYGLLNVEAGHHSAVMYAGR
ncbi:hypothetical protein V5O48_017312 [Marasmius crinis-equi]|uniref:Integrase zinc-binding domain-containing protein n=1 Tax=Marasmius crinis-equi TaxID=585013 RepID=A0ABR3EPD0_9AGAR